MSSYTFDTGGCGRSCSANLNGCGKSAIMYQTRMRYFPRVSGAHFFKTLYVDPERYIGTPNVLVCPASGDSEADILASWIVGDNSVPPAPMECSYARTNSTTGAIARGQALGSDDHEPFAGTGNPADTQNHQDEGVNLMWPDAATQWVENPPGSVCRVGSKEGNAALMGLMN
ncbi:MAG: hypothetical protein NUW37_13355 [Planctomycetes bacterium]|nr:hypothetical protein [Planctomycetota bacterium]